MLFIGQNAHYNDIPKVRLNEKHYKKFYGNRKNSNLTHEIIQSQIY